MYVRKILISIIVTSQYIILVILLVMLRRTVIYNNLEIEIVYANIYNLYLFGNKFRELVLNCIQTFWFLILLDLSASVCLIARISFYAMKCEFGLCLIWIVS